MAKRLSKQLSDLAVRARNAEDAVSAAEKEVRDNIATRRTQVQASAAAAIEKLNLKVKSIGDTATKNWIAVPAKIAADMDALNASIAERTQDRDARRAENRTETLEAEAGFAIDYAIASVEQAKLAVLDAIAGLKEAEQAKTS